MSAEQANTSINLEGNALAVIAELRDQFGMLQKQVVDMEATTNEALDQLKKHTESAKASMSVLVLDVLGRSADVLAGPFRSGTDAVYDYDASLQELSAITDITGPKLDSLGNMAKDMAKEFGGTPQAHLDSYTKLLSALTPEIANNEVALGSFGRTVAMLANTMGGDATGAVKGLETAMNQYGVDLSDPIEASRKAAEMANIMAAAAKAGKLEVPGLADAMTRSGAEAANAGVSFEEFAASLELGMLKFGSSERLGTAMRGVFQTIGSGSVLPKETQEALRAAGVNMKVVNDQGLTLKQRLTELKKIQGNAALMEKVFGAGETTAGRALLGNLDLLDKYQQEIRDTPNALEEMNNRVMGGFKKQKELLDNFFTDIRLNIFETFGGALPYLDMVGGGLMGIIALAPGIMALHQAIQMLSASTKLQAFWTGITTGLTTAWTAVTGALNAAMMANPAIAITAGIIALVGAVVWAWNTFEGFRGVVLGLWETFKTVFMNIFDFFKKMFGPVLEAIHFAMNGQWKEAALAAGQAIFNIVTMPGQAIGALVSGDITKGSGTAFNKAYDAEVNAAKAENAAEPIAGEPKAKGTGAYQDKAMVPNPTATTDTTPAGGGATGAGGGGRIITVHINNLVEKVTNTFNGGNVDMSQVRDEVRKALIAAVRDFELSAG